MSDQVRVIIQMRTTPALAAASFGPVGTAPTIGIAQLPGVELDASYSPVPITSRSAEGFGMATRFSASEPATHVVRAAVSRDALSDVLARANEDDDVVGVFADPRITHYAVRPRGPVGTDGDVEQLLAVDELRRRGMDGTGVNVVMVDSGFNLDYLRLRGKTPEFNPELSWGPQANLPLGNMPVAKGKPYSHGTMCAYDVCIAAPACTLVDHPLLWSQTPGGSAMDGLLSDAILSYGVLLSYLSKAPEPVAGDYLPRTLVVNNSWGMYAPSWDFAVGDAENYSDNGDHPFNLQVEALEAEGADILFAAGNCGPDCPDGRCEGATERAIYGANSSPAVTCVAGVVTSKERVCYSSVGPGRLEDRKPDIASFTHFAGSGVFDADSGTSAACPVAAGVVAAIRRLYPASVLSPARLRDLLRDTAEPQGDGEYNYEYGYGVINVPNLLNALEQVTSVEHV